MLPVPEVKYESKVVGNCERTFISFSEPAMLQKYFPSEKPKARQRNICPITRSVPWTALIGGQLQ